MKGNKTKKKGIKRHFHTKRFFLLIMLVMHLEMQLHSPE